MPGYKGHLMGGLAAYGVLLYLVVAKTSPTLLTASEWLGFTLAGALFPDIDVKSKGQKYFYWFFLLLLLLFIAHDNYPLLATTSVISMIPMLVRHRGLFHRLWFVVGMPLVFWYAISFYVPQLTNALLLDTLFFIVGAVSHLWLDLGMKRLWRF